MKLYIDSSTSYLYLAIPSLNVSFTRSGKNDHSETLVDYLSQFLKEHHVNIDDIKEVVIGRGPGSYTGLRIAGTVGKVLAYTKKLSFKSFSSLDLLLAKVIENDGNYIARIVAKKNHSYIKVVKVNNGKIEVILDDSFVEDSFLEQYQEYQMIEPSDQIFASCDLAITLDKLNLIKEESEYDYVPNYLRSGI
jgi:tRNA threonylcarbamoyladenosine biosynthesis protein TsaB